MNTVLMCLIRENTFFAKSLHKVHEMRYGALALCGQAMTVDEVVFEILRDAEFYEQSGGGITLSGGEPLLQKAKTVGIHTAIETSGYCSRGLEEIGKYVDLWLYDIKLFS